MMIATCLIKTVLKMQNKRILILGNCFGNLANNTLRIGKVAHKLSDMYSEVINPMELLLDMGTATLSFWKVREMFINEVNKADAVYVMKCATDNLLMLGVVQHAKEVKETIYLK
jgi:hypothetical protein